MTTHRAALFAFLFVTPILSAESLPIFGDFPLLRDANVLRMEPPFETRYYFTFEIAPGQSVTVYHDIYYDINGYNQSKDRVLIGRKSQREYLVPSSDYPRLYERLPKSLILAEKASVGISLQDCVASYAKLLSDLKGK